jgi:hypothetical protein
LDGKVFQEKLQDGRRCEIFVEVWFRFVIPDFKYWESMRMCRNWMTGTQLK